jgi:hypothetical protein
MATPINNNNSTASAVAVTAASEEDIVIDFAPMQEAFDALGFNEFDLTCLEEAFLQRKIESLNIFRDHPRMQKTPLGTIMKVIAKCLNTPVIQGLKPEKSVELLKATLPVNYIQGLVDAASTLS